MPVYRFPVNISYPLAGGPGVNVWHVRTTGSVPSTGELAGLSEIIRQFYQDVAQAFPNTVDFDYEGVATTIDVDPQYDSSAPAWHVDGQDGVNGFLPPASAIVTTWLTTSASRRGRGRTFLSPLSTGVLQADGTIATFSIGVIQDAADALVASSSGFANGAVGVWSTVDQVLRDFTGANVRDIFAVLRSRRD